MGNVSTLQQAIDLSDQILLAIELQEMEKIAKIDKKRREVIDVYFKNTGSIDAELTRLLKQKNDKIVSQLVDMRQKTRSQQVKMNQGQKVSKAYLDNENYS